MTEEQTAKPQPGESVSEGTLRTQDLALAFLSTLDAYAPDRAKAERDTLLEIAKETLGEDWEYDDITSENIERLEGEDCIALSCWLNEDLFSALSDIAPDDCYFGASEGDGASFGFWPLDVEDEQAT